MSLKISLEDKAKSFFLLSFSPKKSLQAFLVKVESGDAGKITIKRDCFSDSLDQTREFQELNFSEFFYKQTEGDLFPEGEQDVLLKDKMLASQSIDESQKKMVCSGIQVDLKNSDFSEKSFIDQFQQFRQENSNFYKETIQKMQEQMSILSQAIVQINHNLTQINQKIFLDPSPQGLSLREQSSRKLVQDMMPQLTTKSLSISDISHQHNVHPEDLDVSHTISEAESKRKRQHRRYKTTSHNFQKLCEKEEKTNEKLSSPKPTPTIGETHSSSRDLRETSGPSESGERRERQEIGGDSL